MTNAEFCPKCGSPKTSVSAEFCGQCGAFLPSIIPILCPKCGTPKKSMNAEFCGQCGAAFDKPVQSPIEPAVPTAPRRNPRARFITTAENDNRPFMFQNTCGVLWIVTGHITRYEWTSRLCEGPTAVGERGWY